ncbi:MFS transporter [Orbus wheelerorum]|uniref:MFS transporter n=1 Tax=Orbus wheelerorum TaxID=3074111 RepID=UPI00370DDCC3
MKLKDIILLIALGMAGGAIYLLPYMKYYFYNQMVDSTGLSGQDLGFLVTMYGIAQMFVLLPGGIIADRISSRTCICLSLIATGVLTIIYGYVYTSYIASLVIWFLLAFTTLFLAWPAILKSVRAIGGENSGTAYSIYYASNGLTGALGGYLIIKVYSACIATSGSSAYTYGMITSALVNIIIALVLFYLLRDMKESASGASKMPTVKDSLTVLKLPIIWVITLALFCTYTLYVGMSFFTPYLTDAFHMSNETSGTLSLVRSYVFMSLTPLTGLIADRLLKSTLKWFMLVCPILIIVLLGVIVVGENVNVVMLVSSLTMLIAFFICTIYSSMFSILSECKIPIAVAGTAISLVSIFAYTPDMFIQPLFGYFADKNQYQFIFCGLILASLLAGISCFILLKMNKRKAITD